MAKTPLDVVKETAHPAGEAAKQIVDASGAAVERLDRARKPMVAGAQAVGTELYDFFRERTEAYAQAMVELQSVRNPLDLWQLQLRFGQRAMQAYAGEVARLTSIVMASAKDSTGQMQRGA